MKTLHLLLAMLSFVCTASAEELTWAQLVKRPEHWPTQCAMKKALEFQSGKKIAVGQKVDVLEIHDGEIVVGANGMSFGTKPTDTDILAVANAEYAKLTPAQRELTYASLLTRKDLWPYRVALTEPIDLGNERIPKGAPCVLLDTKGNELSLLWEKTKTGFELEVKLTDLLAQARNFVEHEDAIPSRVAEELQGKLIDPISGAPKPLDPKALPRYYVFYRGGGYCPYTREMTPSIVEFYKQTKAAHPELELIFVPTDKTATEMQAYAKEASFPWRSVSWEQCKKFAVLAPLFGPVPHFVVVDPAGNRLMECTATDRGPVLAQLTALLDKPVEKK